MAISFHQFKEKTIMENILINQSVAILCDGGLTGFKKQNNLQYDFILGNLQEISGNIGNLYAVFLKSIASLVYQRISGGG